MGIVTVLGPTQLVYDLTTTDTITDELKVSLDTEAESILQQQITSASKLIADSTGWSNPFGSGNGFALREVSELFLHHAPWHYDNPLVLFSQPLIEVSSVFIDGIEEDPSLYDVDLHAGLIYRIHHHHHFHPYFYRSTVVVNYTTGYDLPDDAPAGLERACIELVKQQRFNANRDPAVRRVSHGDSLVDYWVGARGGTIEIFPPAVKELLADFQRISV